LLIKALREELEEPSAKASVVFANGFPKPTSHKENERRKLQGITNFVPPIVKSLRVPDRNETGFIVRGGIVGQGAAISVRIEKNLETKQFEFTPKYAAKDVYQLPRQNSTSTPIAKMHIELLSNSFVAIDHPNTIYCFAETRRRLDQTGRVLIDIEPLFPDKIFVGYYNNYAPSNGQTVLRLHDNSYFFLLADGGDISLTQQVLTERKKINTRKNSKTPSIDLTEYVLLADVDLPRPRTFARTKEISRQIFDAKSIDRLTISNLGRWNFNSRQ
jgi:hypothetical protein